MESDNYVKSNKGQMIKQQCFDIMILSSDWYFCTILQLSKMSVPLEIGDDDDDDCHEDLSIDHIGSILDI